MDMDPDLDAAIPPRERKCPGVLSRQAGTLPQLRRMYPVMRGNYEKPPWELCDRRGLFALDCRTDGRWDDRAGRYGPCLPCLDLLSGKHAARLNSWMNPTVNPKDTEPHYRQGPHVVSRRLNKANDRGYVAQETMGELQEDPHQFRQRCETYKALAVAIAEDDRPLAGRRAARLLQAGWAPAKVPGHLCDPRACNPGMTWTGMLRRWQHLALGPQVVAGTEQRWVPAQLRHGSKARRGSPPCSSERTARSAVAAGGPRPHPGLPCVAPVHRRNPCGGHHHCVW